MFKKTLSAALLFAVAGLAHAAENKPLDLSLPAGKWLNDDWYAASVTPVNVTVHPAFRRSQPQNNAASNTRTEIDFGGHDQLSDLRSLERKLTTFTFHDHWKVRLKPRSRSRGSLEMGYARSENCPLGLTTCSVTFSAQRMRFKKLVRDAYEGGEIGNFIVDELYKRPYNPMFAGEAWDNDDREVTVFSVTFRATW